MMTGTEQTIHEMQIGVLYPYPANCGRTEAEGDKAISHAGTPLLLEADRGASESLIPGRA